MIALKLIAALAFVCLQASGKDVDTYKWISDCVQKNANKKGIPIPPVSPYKVDRSVTVTDTDKHLTITYTNINVYDILAYKLTATQQSKDTDPVAVINFNCNWPTLVVKVHFAAHDNKNKYEGDATYTLKGVKWVGTVSYQKPQKGHYGGTETAMDLTWTNEGITAVLTSGTTPPITQKELYAFWSKQLTSNKKAIQEYLRGETNKKWASQPKKIEALFNFCKNNK